MKVHNSKAVYTSKMIVVITLSIYFFSSKTCVVCTQKSLIEMIYTSFVDLFMFLLSCVCYAFVRVCLYVPCGHLLGKG